MFDSDSPFDDADAAAALFELAAPDLPPPASVRREATGDPEIAIWAVHAKGTFLRMKVAGAEAAVARLRRGAHVLPSLAARGVRVPEPLRVVEKPGGAPVTVVIERRLGTTNAAVGWAVLGAGGRLAFAEAFARALLDLHRTVPAAEAAAGPASDAGRPAPVAWRAVVEERVRHRVAFLRDADVLDPASAVRIEERLLAHAAKLPSDLDRSFCHGNPGLATAALERRAFAGIQDFESACVADRWLDVAAAQGAFPDSGGRPWTRFLDVYASVVEPPADFASRVDLYQGLTMLRILSGMAKTSPSGARAAAERVTERLVDRGVPVDR